MPIGSSSFLDSNVVLCCNSDRTRPKKIVETATPTNDIISIAFVLAIRSGKRGRLHFEKGKISHGRLDVIVTQYKRVPLSPNELVSPSTLLC